MLVLLSMVYHHAKQAFNVKWHQISDYVYILTIIACMHIKAWVVLLTSFSSGNGAHTNLQQHSDVCCALPLVAAAILLMCAVVL